MMDRPAGGEQAGPEPGAGPARVDYVVLSHVIIDDLRFVGGGERRGVLGGAGSYAAAGLRLAARPAERVGIACGVGEDFPASEYAAWFRENRIDAAGLEPRGRRTPRSRVVYRAEDARTETPAFGGAHFARMAPDAGRLPPAYRRGRGYYLFQDHAAPFWRAGARLREETGGVVLWELHAAAAEPDRLPAVVARAANVDLVSLNLAEGRRLCGRREPQAIVARLLAAGVRGVALRLGAAGALLARGPAECWRVPTWPAPAVDVTGAGNAFGGALLAGLAGGGPLGSGADWPGSGCGAAAAASLMLAQSGPPPRLDRIRDEWRRRRDALRSRVRRADLGAGVSVAGAAAGAGARAAVPAP